MKRAWVDLYEAMEFEEEDEENLDGEGDVGA